MSDSFFGCRLCWPWGPDVSPELISGGLPAGDGHLLSPHPRPSPAIERSLFPTAGLAGEGRRFRFESNCIGSFPPGGKVAKGRMRGFS